MRRLTLVLAILLTGCAAAGGAGELRPGDIVFQTSRSTQSQAVQLATHSRYSHMGLVLHHSGELEVLEAAGQVKFTRQVGPPRGRGTRDGQEAERSLVGQTRQSRAT